MKDNMLTYGVTLGRRFTRSDKYYFLKSAAESFPPLGFQTRQIIVKKRINLTAGELDNAKTVIIAAYDTPPVSLIGAPYYPFSPTQSVAGQKRSLLVQILGGLAFALLSWLFTHLFLSSTGFLGIVSAILLGLSVIMALFMFTIRGNRLNFNRNSASLAAMHTIAEKCRGNSSLGLVFLDGTVASSDGYKQLETMCSSEGKTFIVLDCLAQGETLVLAFRPEQKAQAHRLTALAKAHGLDITEREYSTEKAEKNILSASANMMFLVSGSIEDRRFVVKNTGTKKDVQLDIARLERITDTITAFVTETNGTEG